MSRPISQGIEVLVAKASLDPEFKALLLDRRAATAESIGLVLSPAEEAMLAAVPGDQLEAIIARTVVPPEHRRAFLGQAAALMLAALGVMSAGCEREPAKPKPRGSRPDRPPAKEPQKEPPKEPQKEPPLEQPPPSEKPPAEAGIRPNLPRAEPPKEP